jgi:hypothetical protein
VIVDSSQNPTLRRIEVRLWYNRPAHKHYLDNRRARETEHLVIEYCKEHLDEWIIHALAVVFRDERAEEGVDRR